MCTVITLVCGLMSSLPTQVTKQGSGSRVLPRPTLARPWCALSVNHANSGSRLREGHDVQPRKLAAFASGVQVGVSAHGRSLAVHDRAAAQTSKDVTNMLQGLKRWGAGADEPRSCDVQQCPSAYVDVRDKVERDRVSDATVQRANVENQQMSSEQARWRGRGKKREGAANLQACVHLVASSTRLAAQTHACARALAATLHRKTL